MLTISCLADLTPFGIVPLTGESCGLGYRILCDITEPGQRLLAKLFGIPNFALAEPWNRGPADAPHVGSILLSLEMVRPLAVFALLEAGCSEAWLCRDESIVGIQPDDEPSAVELWKTHLADRLLRRFAYQGTAGDRNVHLMSGRVL